MNKQLSLLYNFMGYETSFTSLNTKEVFCLKAKLPLQFNRGLAFPVDNRKWKYNSLWGTACSQHFKYSVNLLLVIKYWLFSEAWENCNETRNPKLLGHLSESKMLIGWNFLSFKQNQTTFDFVKLSEHDVVDSFWSCWL